MTEDIVARLAQDLHPRPMRRVGVRLALAVVLGAVASAAALLLTLGPRPDAPTAMAGSMFWMKLAYPLAVAAVAVACVERLSRPGGRAVGRALWILLPVVLLALAAALQFARAQPGVRRTLVMGESAMICPWMIAACAAPVFVALVWALRGLAPTRPRLAGAAAGLASASVGAAVYALHCTESGGAFVLLWYSLGLLLPALAGALLGPRLLRWR